MDNIYNLNFNTAVMASLISFAIAIILGPIVIPILRRLKFGQNVRDDGPQSHLKKSGTPSMGGIVIVAAISIASGIFSSFSIEWMLIMYLMLSFGIIGFLDDYIKMIKKRSLGLRAYQKFSLQLVASIGFVLLLNWANIPTQMFIPFTDGLYINLGMLTPFVLVFAIVGTSNGVNFTDGLDGLASGVTLLVSLFFLYVAFSLDSPAGYALAAAVGALLGFLLFNSHPARVFMGDTGSLALGGFVAGVAIVLQMPIVLIIVGFVYVMEVASVALQVVYFKATGGKRLFKMAPLHHHFEMMGWAETKVVSVFYIATTILCLIGLLAVSNL
ncbi:MAG: phospho-N-acetylmuramoyl-pentapeptide-transferase [Defluviitaleaceae bacterium]|nr:phospho-N-acetylmuramoyl-pentapeptide-transferase [Defluviitaleaceae bacterium]